MKRYGLTAIRVLLVILKAFFAWRFYESYQQKHALFYLIGTVLFGAGALLWAGFAIAGVVILRSEKGESKIQD